MHVKMTRRFACTSLFALAACGGVSAAAPAEKGVLFSAKFGDNDPVRFNGPAPQRMPVQGIDAARFQKNVNWNTARRNGVNFAFLKATEGGDLLDTSFKKHWAGAGRAGMERGAYHFYYFCTEPEVQARWFIRNVPRSAGNLPPVLDMEWNAFSPTCATVRPPAGEVRALMRRWLALVEAHYGQKAIIYTTPKFYRENGLGAFREYDFWLRTTAKRPEEVYDNQPWTFWQYSSTGTVPGILGEVDLNAFNGSGADWAAWVAARRLGG